MKTFFVVFAVLALLAGPANAGASCSTLIHAGDAHATVGKNKQAIALYTRAIRQCPNYALARHQRGMVFFSLGNFAKAAKDYGRVVAMRPNWVNARKGLAWAILKTGGDASVALKHARYAVAARPSDIRSRDTLATAYATVGKNTKAAEIFESIGNFQAAATTYRAAWNGRWGNQIFWRLNRLHALPLHNLDRA